jgi:hypothetical protein
MSVGAYWARKLAPGDTRWQELSQRVTEGFRRHARSGDNSRGWEWRPQ